MTANDLYAANYFGTEYDADLICEEWCNRQGISRNEELPPFPDDQPDPILLAIIAEVAQKRATELTLSSRARLNLRVAAAITGDDPWACGYAEYIGTAGQLLLKLTNIERDHGGNTVMMLSHKGRRIILKGLSVRWTLEWILDGLPVAMAA